MLLKLKAVAGRRQGIHLLAAFGVLANANDAKAHFVLQQPPAWESQDSVGSPQKLGPCGNEAGGTPTGTVTAFQQGQTITVTINEAVFHPGHYRVALSVNSRSELPSEPVVTATSSTPCGSVPIQSAPAFPVLADGVLQHTAAFTSPQSFQVKLPSDITCTHCTLQIIEFMSNHPLNNPGGCFYHHCADISIQAAATAGSGGTTSLGSTANSGGAPTGGTRSGTGGMPAVGGRTGAAGPSTNAIVNDAGAITNETKDVGSCSCKMRGGSSNVRPLALALALGLMLAGRRRRTKPRGAYATSRTDDKATRRA